MDNKVNKKENIIKKKTFELSVDIINFYKFLTQNKKEYILSKQLLRSGTSIGANVYEAQDAISDKDFLNKLYVSLKESRETEYWILLLLKTGYCSGNESGAYELKDKISEICNILTAIIKTKKLNMENK